LHIAVEQKKIEIIKLLLASEKVDQDITDKPGKEGEAGETVLHYAIFQKDEGMIGLLLTGRKKPLTETFKQDLLSYAEKKSPEILEMLKTKFANVPK
jgi:hypothetical protein